MFLRVLYERSGALWLMLD